MAAEGFHFSEEEMVVDEQLGHPRAYSSLCGDASHRFVPYENGPPFSFYPYALHTQELIRAKDLNQMFPITDPEAKPTANPNDFLNYLWKQLSHLGNAGFDPALFRVDAYGNVIYFYADDASPLSWDIDHWFPCSRGGRTVRSNLRLLQWQVCKRKHNRLEFLIPWWDLQLGISVNQFLSIFASKNLDFRKRAFSFLFLEGGDEELNELQVVESHKFPPQFIEKKRKVGLAPASISSSQKQQINLLASKTKHSSTGERSYGAGILETYKPSISKENQNPNVDSCNNAYMSIALARDSLRQREETKRIAGEIRILEEEMESIKNKNECQRLTIQELEIMLIKKRRRVEKSRRLSEAQNSYKELLEKMLRDAMHQNVIYKEQLRLNQAATGALMARLEAQRAMCDGSEKELHKKHKQKDVIEEQIRSLSETARKRSRVDDGYFDAQHEEAISSIPLRASTIKPTRKELRQFLQEEQIAYESGLYLTDAIGEEIEEVMEGKASSCSRIKDPSTVLEDGGLPNNEVGKDNIEKWLRVLLENAREGSSSQSPDFSPPRKTEEDLNLRNSNRVECSDGNMNDYLEGNRAEKFDEATASETNRSRGMVRSASAGNLRSRLSSPKLIPAMSNKLFKARNSSAVKKSSKPFGV